VVTGAASGIGRATALAFAHAGANVVVSDVANAGVETAEMINAQCGHALFVRCDVSNSENVKQLMQAANDRFGQIDCAFNNAGIGGTLAPTVDYTFEDWNRVLSINLTGVWLCTKYELEEMLPRGRGVIVNNASILGVVGFRGAPA
jgi:NAD(P)-dependent dehydrogenase (short-subunit alcohol dehydrogenase family)